MCCLIHDTSRLLEYRDAGLSINDCIIHGVDKTGSIITTAGLIMVTQLIHSYYHQLCSVCVVCVACGVCCMCCVCYVVCVVCMCCVVCVIRHVYVCVVLPCLLQAVAFSGLLMSSVGVLNQTSFFLVVSVLLDTFLIRMIMVI